MNRLIFWHSFAELVALILLPGLAFYFLSKKKDSVHGNVEDADSGASGSLTAPAGTNAGGSSSSSTETSNGASSSSTALTGNHYEVFLSFRGRDTLKGFTDHLYNGLINAGIRAFKDEKELRRGEKIRPDLLAAIKNSKILIPILSVNYGTSSWCLDELVQIIECKNDSTGYIVWPIFYKVEPSDLRYQKGSFGEAFHERERRLRQRLFDPTILEKWKQALIEVSLLKGWDANGYEAELVKSVVQQVLFELKKKFELVIPENLIGIDSHVDKVMKFVDNTSCATLFVGIHGLGGIGKTTLAKTIYNKLSDQFEYRSFIADIRESGKRNGLEYLQSQLIYDILKQENQSRNEDEGIKFLSSMLVGKKVLVLLDDMDDDDQLKALAGNHNWFSSGSVIIITTRDESILDKACVDCKHEHKELDKDKSLILFSRHAFRRDTPPSEFKELTDEVLSTTGGLPLSLKVLGSLFCGKKATEWGGFIDKLKKVPHKKVQEMLKISYEALDHGQQQIFLDIACFFIGTDWRIASYMWDACGFYSKEGIEVLRFMSLIKVGEYNELRMHDQLRDLGRLIVCEGNENEPEYRSRLWDFEEAWKVLEENEGTRKIEALSLGNCGRGRRYKAEQFKEMTKLRFLLVDGANLIGDFQSLLSKLRWLQWEYCPLDFAAANFHPKKLVILDLSHSAISENWRGWVPLKMATELKVLHLTNCYNLRRTPDLSTYESLEILNLQRCWNLMEIHPSIGDIKTLVSLDVSHCGNLKELPVGISRMVELRELHISGTSVREISISRDCLMKLETLSVLRCEQLAQLPKSMGCLVSLTRLEVADSNIKELPESIGSMKELKILDARDCLLLARIPISIGDLASLQYLLLDKCSSLREIPNSIGKLASLTVLCLVDTSIAELPESIGNMQNLRILRIDGTNVTELPGTIGMLAKLQKLAARRCKSLDQLPSNIGELVSLEELYLDGSGILDLPESIVKLSSLRRLHLEFCTELRELPELPFGLKDLKISCQSPLLPHLSQLTLLETLYLRECPQLECLPELPLGLTKLSIECCGKLKALANLSDLKHLSELTLSECFDLTEVNGQEGLHSQMSGIFKCMSAGQFLDFSSLKYLSSLIISYCENIIEILGLDGPESLEDLSIEGCTSLKSLDLSNLKSLNTFNAENCQNLVEIRGLNGLESLESLCIDECTSFTSLDLSNLKSLKTFEVRRCQSLVEIQSFNGLESLIYFSIKECTSFRSLDLSNFKSLNAFEAEECQKLVEIRGVDGLKFLERLCIEKCTSFGQLLDLSNLKNLRGLRVGGCHDLVDIRGLDERKLARIPGGFFFTS